MVVIKHYKLLPCAGWHHSKTHKGLVEIAPSWLSSLDQDPGVCGETATCTASHALLVPGLKFHLQGLPSQYRNGCISHVQVLAEQKSPKQGDFRVERKKLLPSPFTLQQPKELQAVEGRCVTSAAAVTDCNPEDEEMLSDASFLSHYTASGRKPSCWTGELPQMSQVLLASHSHVSMWE